jgi:hypothetical protein
MTNATTRVEQLHAATLVAIEECRRLNYRPTYWEQMVKELGALDAHKQVLRPGPPHDGFVRLAFLTQPGKVVARSCTAVFRSAHHSFSRCTRF